MLRKYINTDNTGNIMKSLITLYLLFINLLAQAAIPINERNALVGLYNSTNGASWNDNTNWLTNDPCDNNWSGIVCNETGETVTKVVLVSNNLDGTMIPELGDLINLTELTLRNNHLTGSIPIELSALSNLQTLNLSLNQLSGSIPYQLGVLSGLTRLILDHNQLTGFIPSELGTLNNLNYLYLHYNQLDGYIPPEIGDLNNLQWLNLKVNQLTGNIPAELGNLSQLISLQLDNNLLNGSIPPQLGNLSNLLYLIAHDNLLSGYIPEELGNLTNLLQLYLNNNQLTGYIPMELGNLNQLQRLYLNSNLLSGNVPESFLLLTSLTELQLNLGFNCLYTNDSLLDDFLDSKSGIDWSGTQTVAPKNLVITSVNLNDISISWDAIEYESGADGRYHIWYNTTATGSFIDGGTTINKSETTYTITGLSTDISDYFIYITTETDAHIQNSNDLSSNPSRMVTTAPPIFVNGFE